MDLNINLTITLNPLEISIIPSPPSKEVPAWAGDIANGITQILKMLDLVIQKENTLMSELTDAVDAAEAAATQNNNADDAAEALLLKIIDLYNAAAANSVDPAVVARIAAVGKAVGDRSSKLSAAVVAGTPAAPPSP